MDSAKPHDPPVGAGWLGAASLLLVACLTIMVGCVIVPGLPAIAPALGVPNAAGWLVTVPSLGVVLFAVPAGRLIDRVGAHRALCLGLAIYGFLGIATPFLYGAFPVFADRLLLGGATALVMTAGTTLISQFYHGEHRLSMIARQGMAIELGGVVFLAAGGALTKMGWAAPFALYGAAFVFLAMVVLFVPRPRTEPRAAHEIDQAEPRDQAAQTPILIAALGSMTVFFTAVIALPFRLGDLPGGKLDASEIGEFLSGVSLIAVCFAAAMPRIVQRIGERQTLIAAFSCYTVAQALFALGPDLDWGFALLPYLCGAVLLGAGFGLSIPLVNHMTIEHSAPQARGRNLARLSMAIFLGQFLASPLPDLPGGTTAGFAAAAVIGLAIALGAACVGRKNSAATC